MIELMRQTKPTRKRGKPPVLTPEVLARIERDKPKRRDGRVAYYKAQAERLGVSMIAIYKAKARAKA